MSTHKYIDLICVAVLLLTLLLTVLFMQGERFGIRVIVDEDAEGAAPSARFTASDLDGSWDAAHASVITLRGDRASVSGGGAYFRDGSVVIAGAGRYVLRGELDDGGVIVDAGSGAKVWLLLDGVTLRRGDDACLRVEQADKVFLTLAAGSVNSMTGGEAYSERALADKTDGVIFSHDDLTINGSGSLTVTAGCGHGIAVNDELVITGGVLDVSAPWDAIHANEGLRIRGAAVKAQAGDDAIALKSAEGLLLIESGTFALSAVEDGVHSGGEILIEDGSLEISAGDDGIHADGAVRITGGTVRIDACYEGIEALTIDIGGGELTIFPTDDGLNANGASGPFPPDAPEAGGESWIHISGGELTVVNADARDADGLDSNGDILISGGVVRVSLPAGGTNSALDYGSERGGVCAVSGGEIVACGSYSMAESFDASSAQCSILYNFSEGADAGTTVSLESADGRTLLSWTPPCSYSSVALSSPELRLGKTYRVVIGDRSEELTISETAAAYGNAASARFGGSMNWGGMEGPGRRPERDGGAPMEPPSRDRRAADDERPDGAPMGPPERPDDDGGRPRTSAVPEVQTEQTEQTEQTQTAFIPIRETWLLLGLWTLILAGGLVLAIRYEP